MRRLKSGKGAAAFLAAVAVLAGCGESEFRYVTDRETNTYLKVPRDWTRYDGDVLFDAEAKLLEDSGEGAPSEIDRRIERLIQWRVGFDSSPKPSPLHVAGLSDAVVVDVRVRDLLARERDQVNQAALRNLVVPYDELLQQEAADQSSRRIGETTNSNFRPLREDEITRDNGMRGVRLTYQLRGDDGFYTIDQLSLVDGHNRRLWVLLVRASDDEYRANQAQIDEIIESFTIKQKG